MQSLVRLFIVVLVCAGLAVAQSVIPFRLLSSHQPEPTDAVREFDYNVSVEQNLDVSGIKTVICSLSQSEKPSAYDVLSIGIYYKLDHYDTDQREHRIAQYHWNKDSPKNSRRLVVNKDAKGQPLPEWRFYDFNHAKSCK